jgi:hypothetical protein
MRGTSRFRRFEAVDYGYDAALAGDAVKSAALEQKLPGACEALTVLWWALRTILT